MNRFFAQSLVCVLDVTLRNAHTQVPRLALPLRC